MFKSDLVLNLQPTNYFGTLPFESSSDEEEDYKQEENHGVKSLENFQNKLKGKNIKNQSALNEQEERFISESSQSEKQKSDNSLRKNAKFLNKNTETKSFKSGPNSNIKANLESHFNKSPNKKELIRVKKKVHFNTETIAESLSPTTTSDKESTKPSKNITKKQLNMKQNKNDLTYTTNKSRRDKADKIAKHDVKAQPSITRNQMWGISKEVSDLFDDNPEIPTVVEDLNEEEAEDVFSNKIFKTLDIAYQIISTLEKHSKTSMTKVQEMSIPELLTGRDMLIKSQTGSGKTLAYAVPILHTLMKQEPKVSRKNGILALVVVPTRELALQSYQCFHDIGKSCVWVVPGYMMGGEKKKSEKARLRKGINILVATPGRLIDHIKLTESLSLAKLKYLVLDEADRMLEMGYKKVITDIINSIEKQQADDVKRQTILLSATLTAEVKDLAGLSLREPGIIDVCENEATSSLMSSTLVIPKNLKQHFVVVPPKLRLVTLAAFILKKCRFGQERKVLIFMATQDMVDFHAWIFSQFLARFENTCEGMQEEHDGKKSYKNTIEFLKLHGNMTQSERTAVFNKFRNAASGVLLSTDVASRGLDLPSVHWIVQYNVASTATDYVHRVGRTARASAIGWALVLLAPSEAKYIQMLHSHKIRICEMNISDILATLCSRELYAVNKRVPKSYEEASALLQSRVESAIRNDAELHEISKKAFVSFVRSYASYSKEVREYLSFKQLNLGHYAKSFGLHETPSELGASLANKAKVQDKNERLNKKRHKQKHLLRPESAQNLLSEFSTGFESSQGKTSKRNALKQNIGTNKKAKLNKYR